MPITDLRYLREGNVDAYRRVVKDQFRQIIHSYGIDTVYFRKSSNLFDTQVQSANYIYGEDITGEFSTSAEVVTYMVVNEYDLLTNKMSIETQANGDCYILIDDFHEQFRDVLGTIHNVTDTVSVSADILSGNVSIINEVTGIDLSGYNTFDLSFITSGNFIDSETLSGITRYPLPHNKDLYWTKYYTQQVVNGYSTLTYDATVDINGNGIVTGQIVNNYNYYVKIPDKEPKDWGITPQPGDFFRIQFHDPLKQPQEYEITEVKNKQLMPDGLNPLLDTYVWRLSIVKRIASYENIASDIQSELPVDQKQLVSQYIEREADKTFDYTIKQVDTIDGVNSDDIYGSYSKKVYDTLPPTPPITTTQAPLPMPPTIPSLPITYIDSYVAGGNIGLHKLVQFNSAGKVVLADAGVFTSVVGMSTVVATTGNTIQVQNDNLIVDSSWNLIPDTGVFLTTNGNFTQVMPNSNIHMFGIAISATSIQLNTDYNIIQ